MQSPTVLILDHFTKISQLYAVSLETYVGCKVVQKDDIDEACKFIMSYKPQIIITRGTIKERDIGAKFHYLISQNKWDTNLIVLGKTNLSAHHAVTLDEKSEVSVLIKNVANLLGVTAKEMAARDVGDFYSFKLTTLFPKLELVCDIFTQFENSEPTKFLEKGSRISKEIVQILKMQNHQEFLVHSGDRLRFVNSLMIHLSEFLASDQLSVQDTVVFANHAYRLVRESAENMQIGPEVLAATESNINTMMSIVQRIPKINKLIEITTHSSDDHFRHSLLICFLCNHIVENIEWGTRDQKVKLTFVSFFHNITLPSELILINTEEELENFNAPKEMKEKIENHAIDAAKVLLKFKTKIPFGVETIIKQHHGSQDGIGFGKISQSISPLANVFMLADEWVTSLMKSEKRSKPLTNSELLNILRNKYSGTLFEPIFQALEKLE